MITSAFTRAREKARISLDHVAFMVGLIGFMLFVMGVWFIYWPAALIVAGCGLLAWSYLTARAVALTRNFSQLNTSAKMSV